MSDNKFDGVWGFNVEEVIKDSVEPKRTSEGIIISDHLDIDHKFSEEEMMNAIRLPTNNKGEVILDPHNETHRDWYESFDNSDADD